MYLESKEKIRKPKTPNVLENKDQQVIDNLKKSKKTFLFKILLLTFIFILIISIGIVLFLYLKNKDNQKTYIIKPDSGEINKEPLNLPKFQQKLSEEKNNSITAVYSLQKDEESVFFNPETIGLNDKNYQIEVLSVKDKENNSTVKTLRHLEDISYKYLSQITGKIEIRISFNIILTSMFQLFKDCRNLLEIDLSKLDSSNLKDLNSAFENCDNLEFANLTLANGDKIQSMDNSFNGCQKLKNIDLTQFAPKQNVSLENAFKNCANLNYVDLSSFHSYNFAGIFVGCLNLVININTQENTNIDLNEIVKAGEEPDLKCEIGPGPKCKKCMEGTTTSQFCDD